MKKMEKGKTYFLIIGGQYNRIVYGWRPTLLGAKRFATQCKEFWDNWQGWHTPKVVEVSLGDLDGVFRGKDGVYYLKYGYTMLDQWLWDIEQAGLELPPEYDNLI